MNVNHDGSVIAHYGAHGDIRTEIIEILIQRQTFSTKKLTYSQTPKVVTFEC